MELEYQALTIGLGDELFCNIQSLLTSCKLQLVPSLTIKDATRLLNQQIFHLLIVDLEYLRSIQQTEWLAGIRRISFAPVVVLSDTPEQDTHLMVQLGADICLSSKHSYSLIADFVEAQFRRYTEYNHYDGPGSLEVAHFQVGDIFIDPPRRIVEVRNRPIELRPREFSLLLYFMRNPNIVLSSEQICEQAWGMAGSYNQGVAQPIRILRQTIEPDPKHPVYIQTVYRAGYRFVPNNVNSLDIR